MPKTESMTASDAARVLAPYEGWDQLLKSRATGVIWMVWGITAPAIFVTFSFAARMLDPQPPWFGLLWMPWAALAFLATALIWRSAGLTLPGARMSVKHLAFHGLAFGVAILGSVIVVLAFRLPIFPPAAVLAAIGLLTLVTGLRHVFARQGSLGVLPIVCAVLFFAVAITESFVFASLPRDEGTMRVALINAPTIAMGFFAIGLRYYFRG